MLVKPEGKRKKVKRRMRWMDGVEKDLRNLGLVNWKTKSQEQAKIHKGFVVPIIIIMNWR
jgi:hypothetical protein